MGMGAGYGGEAWAWGHIGPGFSDWKTLKSPGNCVRFMVWCTPLCHKKLVPEPDCVVIRCSINQEHHHFSQRAQFCSQPPWCKVELTLWKPGGLLGIKPRELGPGFSEALFHSCLIPFSLPHLGSEHFPLLVLSSVFFFVCMKRGKGWIFPLALKAARLSVIPMLSVVVVGTKQGRWPFVILLKGSKIWERLEWVTTRWSWEQRFWCGYFFPGDCWVFVVPVWTRRDDKGAVVK